jgi:hypothetical protein
MLCYTTPEALQKRGEKTSFGKYFLIYQNIFCFGAVGFAQNKDTVQL